MFRIVCASLFVTLTASPVSSVFAADYPDNPVRIIIPFSPGGGTDVITRFLQPRIEKNLGAGLLIDNRSGAGGTIGVGVAAQVDPDGYTLLITSASFTFADAIYKDRLAYDSKKRFPTHHDARGSAAGPGGASVDAGEKRQRAYRAGSQKSP